VILPAWAQCPECALTVFAGCQEGHWPTRKLVPFIFKGIRKKTEVELAGPSLSGK